MKSTDSSLKIEAWFEEFHPRLLGYLTHDLNVEAEAEDLAQEVFLRLLRLDDPNLINHPRAFLFRIASNVVADWRERNSRVVLDTPESFEAIPSPANPLASLATEYRSQAIDRALKRLPPMQSATVLLRVRHGKSYKEIARHLGVSERMVKRYVVKGFARLRGYLANV